MPRCEEEYHTVSRWYEQVGLPGCMGSVDVVHVKWLNCPLRDYNRAKGKESYPSLAFECISDYDRRICGVYGPQFGLRNDKHIVKNDDNVLIVAKDWSFVQWQHFDDDGKNCKETGAYLICDNGYLQWPTLLCPFMRSETNGPYESCYSANLESVRKDVECVWRKKLHRNRCIPHLRQWLFAVADSSLSIYEVRDKWSAWILLLCKPGKCEKVWHFEGKVWISQLWFQTSPDSSLQMGFSCMLCYSQHDARWDEKRTTDGAIGTWLPNAGFGNVVVRSNGIGISW
jgi:hypothetical protein